MALMILGPRMRDERRRQWCSKARAKPGSGDVIAQILDRPPSPSDRTRTGRADVVSHDCAVSRGPQMAARIQDVRPVGADVASHCGHHRRGAASANNALRQARQRRPCPGLRGEHSSTETNASAVRGPAQVVVQPGDPGRPGHAVSPNSGTLRTSARS